MSGFLEPRPHRMDGHAMDRRRRLAVVRAIGLGLEVWETPGVGFWLEDRGNRRVGSAVTLAQLEHWLDGFAAATPYGRPLGNRQASVDSSAPP